MKLKINTSSDAVQESSGSSFINQSGIYDVTIKFASLAVSSGGAESVNFNVGYNGSSQTIYGPYVTDKSNQPIEIGMKLINKLGIIAGMDAGDELEIEEETHNVGKDNKPQDFAVIQQFSDLPVKMRVQEEYTINPKTNEIQQRLVIKAFFRADGASAEEIVNDTEIGKRLAIETEKYATNVTYRDDLTPEAVAEWKAAKAAERTGGAKPTAKAAAKPTVKPKTGGLFGK